MNVSDIAANSELVCVWEEQDVWARPVTQGQLKRVRRLSQQAQRLAGLAGRAHDEALDAELELMDARTEGDDDEIKAAENLWKDLGERAESLEAKADEAQAAVGALIFTEIVVDANGEPLNYDADNVAATLVARLWARIEEAHRNLGKSKKGKRKRTARSGSARRA